MSHRFSRGWTPRHEGFSDYRKDGYECSADTKSKNRSKISGLSSSNVGNFFAIWPLRTTVLRQTILGFDLTVGRELVTNFACEIGLTLKHSLLLFQKPYQDMLAHKKLASVVQLKLFV